MIDNLNFEIEKIKYEIAQKESNNIEIKKLITLSESPYVSKNQVQTINKKIDELKTETDYRQLKGIDKLKKFRLNREKTALIEETPQFIYPKLLELGKTIMFFGESGIGKTLMCAAFANYALLNNTISSAIFLDFDNGVISLKKRKYDYLSEIWGEKKFNYLLGEEILQEMEAIDSLKELVLDGDSNKGRMIVLDSGSHFVYDGTKNERAKLKEFLDVIKILRAQGATPIIIHHSHRVRDGQIADYHGSFEWKRDLDYQFLITKNEENNCWLFHVKKDRDNLVESKAFKYEEETILLEEVDFEESNIDQKEYLFVKNIKKILQDIGEKINQTELLKETRSIRQTLGFGEKRSIKLFQEYTKKGIFMSERKSDQKNSIFYWVEQTTKVEKLAKQNIKGEN